MSKKKIEALFFTDLHLNAVNKDTCMEFIQEMINFIQKKNVDKVFFLGDFTDNRKGLDEPTITTTLKIFQMFSKLDTSFYMMPGNHDKFIVSGTNSYLDAYFNTFYKGFKNMHLYREPYLLELQGKYNYAFFPYFEGELFDKGLEYLNKNLDKSTILLGHYMYEQIPSEIKRKYIRTYLGHNHERTEFPNGMYLGSCFQQGFAEEYNKGFSILYDDLSIDLIPFSSVEYVIQKIDVNSFEEQKVKEYILNFLNKYPDKRLRIELVGYNKNISELKEFCKQHNVSFISNVESNTINEREEILNISEFSQNQIKKYWEIFCKENQINNKVKEKVFNIINNQ